MGVLTNANNSEGSLGGMLTRLVKHSALISWLFYFCGFAFIFVMPWVEFSHKTYFSENALLPGLVRSEFDEAAAASRYLQDLREEAANHPNSPPFPWIEARLRQIGLEVYTHNFSLKFPLASEAESKNVYTGRNVYAILRAPRASGTEALVMSTPYRASTSLEPSTDVSVALLLASAKFFRRQKYWAKDVLFLITQHEQLGMQAFLEAYHKTSCGHANVLDHGDLEARAGAIQAAINLEFKTEKITHINVKVEGLNGQLPNLDLVNLIHRLCIKEGVHQMFQGVEDHPRPASIKGYLRSLSTLASMATKQAAGVPSGNHGLFHRFGIEAVTVEGVHLRSKRHRGEADLYTVGRIVEGIFRSLNNLLERFHQSFFFYLLPSSGRYVSIGMYMPGFGLLAGGLLVTALALWFDCLAGERGEDHSPLIRCPDLFSAIPVFVLSHFLGLMVSFMPRPASVMGAKIFGLPADDSVGIGVAASVLVSAILVLRTRKADNWKVVKCMALLELAAVAFTMALCNFSLAYMASLVYVPAALLARPTDRFLSLRKLVVLLAHPMVLLALACLIDTWREFPDSGVLTLLSSSLTASKTALMYSITDSYIYGNVSYLVATVFVMPCWHLLWSLVN